MVNVNPADWNGWVWPVPLWDGRTPVISDGWSLVKTANHREHLGVDLTFRKRPTDPSAAVLHDVTKSFISPAGTPIIAAGPGKIWSTARTDHGLSITIDHGNVGRVGGVCTFYQHLASYAQQWKRGDVVQAGTLLGVMGYSPAADSERFRHLHFELWFPTRKHARDPALYLRHWRKITLPGRVT